MTCIIGVPAAECLTSLPCSAEYQPQRSAAADAARLAAVIERCGRPSTGKHASPMPHGPARPAEAHPLVVVRLLWGTKSELAQNFNFPTYRSDEYSLKRSAVDVQQVRVTP